MKQVSKNEYVKIESGKRVLVISDIHGGFESFKEILAEANFSPDDYLFIVGDVINTLATKEDIEWGTWDNN